jgi:cytochrome c biogenesis protein CcmG, thiol:disulfide interchange protein DsbE
MKNILVLFALIIFATVARSQSEDKALFTLPEVDVKTLNGEPFNTKNISNDGKPIIMTFWATWCKPCMKEHDALNELYPDWAEETGVKIYAVSIDNARSSRQVLPTVNGKGWDFDVLLDPNGNLKRAMNVNIPPHTFIIDGQGNIVWQHIGYMDGDEIEYIEIVEKLIAGKKID